MKRLLLALIALLISMNSWSQDILWRGNVDASGNRIVGVTYAGAEILNVSKNISAAQLDTATAVIENATISGALQLSSGPFVTSVTYSGSLNSDDTRILVTKSYLDSTILDTPTPQPTATVGPTDTPLLLETDDVYLYATPIVGGGTHFIVITPTPIPTATPQDSIVHSEIIQNASLEYPVETPTPMPETYFNIVPTQYFSASVVGNGTTFTFITPTPVSGVSDPLIVDTATATILYSTGNAYLQSNSNYIAGALYHIGDTGNRIQFYPGRQVAYVNNSSILDYKNYSGDLYFVVNDGSTDTDIRMESDGNVNMFIIDAGENVCIAGSNSVTDSTHELQAPVNGMLATAFDVICSEDVKKNIVDLTSEGIIQKASSNIITISEFDRLIPEEPQLSDYKDITEIRDGIETVVQTAQDQFDGDHKMWSRIANESRYKDRQTGPTAERNPAIAGPGGKSIDLYKFCTINQIQYQSLKIIVKEQQAEINELKAMLFELKND